MARTTHSRYSTRGARSRRSSSRGGIKRLIKRIILVLFFFGVGAVAGLASVFYYLSLDLPPIGPLLEGYDPPQTTRILAADGTVIGELFVERRTLVPIDDIPDVMVNAVIAAEDSDFRTHEGLDYIGMIRAILKNVSSGRRAQGASTITQQVARTFFLSREKTYTRKIKEILLTKRIEERLTKDEILYLYLNQINFGRARYGVGEAARFYFGKSIREVTVAEAALLAGIPKGPAVYDPFRHPEAAKERRAYVIGEMERHGLISPSDAELARTAPLGLIEERRVDTRLAPEAMSRALAEIEEIIGKDELRRGGYTIETTISPALQAAAREAVRAGLTEVDARHGRVAPFKKAKGKKRAKDPGEIAVAGVYTAQVKEASDDEGTVLIEIGGRQGIIQVADEARYNPKRLPPSRFARQGARIKVRVDRIPDDGSPFRASIAVGPEAALAAIDPSTGKIVALVGGERVRPGGFDRAADALRQPGSSFKPFVYLEAVRGGRYTAASLLDDSPEVDGDWIPKNSHADGFEGAVSMRRALAASLNLPAVKLIRAVGPSNVAALARSLGVKSKLDEGPALALGASSVSPLEMASAYGAIAAGGVAREPWVVARVLDPHGKEVPLRGRTGAQVVTPQEAYIVTSLLESVVREGTGAKAKALGRPAAGKTGTTNDAKDAWFIGFTPDLCAAAWVGYDEPRTIGRKEYGSRAALPIWLAFMKAAHVGKKVRDFEEPEGIVRVEIDPASGLLAYEGMESPVSEIFIEGTEPTEEAVPPDLLTPEDFMAEQLLGLGAVDGGSGAPDGGIH